VKKVQRRRGLTTALILAAAASLVTLVAPAVASAAPAAGGCSLQQLVSHARADGISGVMPAAGACSTGIKSNALVNAPASGTSSPYYPGANPPLLFNGTPGCGPSTPPAPCENGNLMMTNQTGPLVVTPIFWNPPGHAMPLLYKLIITGYLLNVALASGSHSNVFSVLNEYSGNNGQVNYNVRLGLPVNDTDPLPTSGCTLNSADTTGIYSDGSGYNACLDDAQLRAEVDQVTAARGLPHSLNHIYVLYLPKGAESCILPGETTSTSDGQFCTINYQPTAAYCAYHSEDLAHAVYANMPFPVYDSAAGPTCGSEFNFGEIQSPNHDPDADVEISPSSHEISEAITDPDTQSGYYTALPIGFEIGDLCAYIYGSVKGQDGTFYNQTINGFHYLTQQEFSNKDFAITGKGCVQNVRQEA